MVTRRIGRALALAAGVAGANGCSDDGTAADGGGTATEATSAATSTSTSAPADSGSTEAASSGADTTSAGESSGGPPVTEGMLSVLTYNVAGLPEPLSSSMPATYTPLISPLLNPYDLVLVQEDFAYHEDLVSAVDHPHLSDPKATGTGDPLGDGLNRMSRHPFADHAREAWEVCNGMIDSGSDCLTMKGFAFARHELSPGVFVDVYNLHMDAGGSAEDHDARAAQTDQLLAAMAEHSEGMALVVAGDTNMGESSEAIFQTLLEGAGLVDACRELGCGEDTRIDRIMLRNGGGVVLTPDAWRIDDTFVTDGGEPLSDHEAVAIDVHWALR